MIEVDTELQRVASISDHLIQNLSLLLTKNHGGGGGGKERLVPGAGGGGGGGEEEEHLSAKDVQNLKQAALRVKNSL